MKSRIMYIESRASGLVRSARIDRVTFSKTGATPHDAGKSLQRLKGGDFKSNYIDGETGEPHGISGPGKDGQDSLSTTNVAPEVDEDVRDEYWSKIRGLPVPTRSK